MDINKYKKAFNEIANIVEDEEADGYYQPRTLRDFYYSVFDTLQELVDKSIPKKVLEVSKDEFESTGYKYCCPSCGMLVGTITKDGSLEYDDYCCSCGQMLNWEDAKDE